MRYAILSWAAVCLAAGLAAGQTQTPTPHAGGRARALAAGVKIHGATVHFVAEEMDSGPIVAQGALAVREDDNPETLAARVLGLEHRIYPQALRLVAEGRVTFDPAGDPKNPRSS